MALGEGGTRQLKFRKGERPGQLDLSLLVPFVKFGGEDLLGVVPRRVKAFYATAQTGKKEEERRWHFTQRL